MTPLLKALDGLRDLPEVRFCVMQTVTLLSPQRLRGSGRAKWRRSSRELKRDGQ